MAIKIDNKYFVPFVLIVAGVSAILIVWYTVQSREERQQRFRKHITQQDTLQLEMMPYYVKDDSISVQSFKGKYVMLTFWATWTAKFSKTSHEQLKKLKKKYPKKFEVIVAVVEDKPKKVKKYLQRHEYPFHYVHGTALFEQYGLPGVPLLLFYSPQGDLLSIFTGSANAARMDSLKAMITNG